MKPLIVYRSTVEIVHPSSPSDSIEVETLAILCPGTMPIGDAMAALEIKGDDWATHERLTSEGDSSLLVLTRTS